MGVDVNDTGIIDFLGHAQAGNLASFKLIGGALQFQQSGHAGHASFVTEGGTTFGLTTSFFDYSSADQGTFTNNGGLASGGSGGATSFNDSAKASQAVITANGAAVTGAFGGITQFADESDAGNATLIANGGSNGGGGGQIQFLDSSNGGAARVEAFGNGELEIDLHRRGVTVGSLEGDGSAILGYNGLTIGANNLSTVFSGIIENGNNGFNGSLTKVGTGTLTLSGTNTYTGGTSVSAGGLIVANTTGSATGTGAVHVQAGTLGGKWLH